MLSSPMRTQFRRWANPSATAESPTSLPFVTIRESVSTAAVCSRHSSASLSGHVSPFRSGYCSKPPSLRRPAEGADRQQSTISFKSHLPFPLVGLAEALSLGSGKFVYDAAPDTSPPPADETVLAGRVRAKVIRQIAPRCPRSQDPENAMRTRGSFTQGTPRGLFGSMGLMAIHSQSASS